MFDWQIGWLMVMVLKVGGMDIEEVVVENFDVILCQSVNLYFGLLFFEVCMLVFGFGFEGKIVWQGVLFIIGFVKVFFEMDVLFVEINFLLVMGQGDIYVFDVKMDFDFNVFFCYFDIVELCDLVEENLFEVEVFEFGFNYIKFDGLIGCMVNGVGFVMVMMDIIQFYGGLLVNFLDVGGLVSQEVVQNVFCIIVFDFSVKVVLINIFGGIVCMDCIVCGVVVVLQEFGDMVQVLVVV